MGRLKGLFGLGMLAALSAGAVDFQKDVRPVLKARCFACHGALKQKAGLRLDTVAALRRGGESGPAVESGNPDKSRLLKRITAAALGDRMPPEGEPLQPREIEALRQWIASGAPAPKEDVAEVDPGSHWAFRPPIRAKNVATGTGNPIDTLLALEHQKRGIRPSPSEDKSLLLRRVYLDLIGLPPTLDELRAFQADTSPDAYEKVVDRLLASPHYGERWGRHWMDIWRYTDWYGLGAQLRHSQKHIWRWRDWILESLNTDKGYDLMIRQMLSADELWPTDRDALAATGFLARNYYLFNRTTWLDDTVEHTAKAFLGLTFQCAKCHDHKFDPISHQDYYKMRAFFEPHQVRLDAWPGQTDLEKDGLPRVFDAHVEAPTHLHRRGNDRDPDTNRLIAPGVPDVLAFRPILVQSVALPMESHSPATQSFVLEDQLRTASEAVHVAEAAVESARRQLAAATNATMATRSGAATNAAGPDFVKFGFDGVPGAQWEVGPGEWKFAEGKYTQSKVGAAERARLRTRQPHPIDFEAIFKFKITGGMMWKSVGLCFDVAAGREKLVYLSAYEGGSKLQLSYDTGAGHAYPPEATQNRPVKLDESYELSVRMRGALVNVAVDGKHALAYRLPIKREQGVFDLITYDAAAQFQSIQIRPLAAATLLVEAGTSTSPPASTPAQLRLALAAAEKALEAAQLRLPMLRAAHAADRARASQEPKSAPVVELVRAAAHSARRAEAAVAGEAVARAESKHAGADAKAKAAAEKEWMAAKAKLAAAQKAVDSPGDQYPSLSASSKAAEGPDESEASRTKPYPKHSTGRRSALSQWVAHRDNPLTARVAVNHIWLRHFGQPLVESVTDFGRRAPAPPLQELLDTLAVDFMEGGWKMKPLHRLMVTSQAYRRSGAALPPSASAPDPDNRFFGRRNATRMESDLIRDGLLHLAGVLDTKLGGPTVSPKGADTANRRSLYFTHSRDDVHPFLDMFDHVNQLDCYRRFESVVPQQALALTNSELAMTMARTAAARLERAGSAADFAARAFEAILCREPSLAERAACETMLAETAALLQRLKHPEPARRARENLVHALFNHNDFITIR